MTPVRTITGSANADLLAMPGTGEVFSRTDSSGTVVPLHDLTGSIIGLVDGTGKIVTQYAYTPFGKPSMSGANNANPFQFAGMEYDSTGLYHTWARYYSPGLQRFFSEDPLGLAGGDTNIFAYVSDDPVNMVDRLGLSGGGTGGGGALPGHGPSWSNCFGDCADPNLPAFPGMQSGPRPPEIRGQEVLFGIQLSIRTLQVLAVLGAWAGTLAPTLPRERVW